jgi:hypothetical protein
MPFVKGQSGNPKGRNPKPRELHEIEELAKTMSVPALMRLSYWVGADDPRASISAAIALLNRAYGMPKQALAMTADITVSENNVIEEMRERIRALRNEPARLVTSAKSLSDSDYRVEQRDAA